MRRSLLPFIAGAVAAVTTATALAQTPAPAPATWPTPKSRAVVVGVSIGGLKLGKSYADMLRLWGNTSSCATEDAAVAAAGNPPIDRTTYSGACRWSDPSDSYAGSATVSFKDGAITNIELMGAQNHKTYFPTAKGPMGKYTITKGKTKLHMASPVYQFTRLYPKAVGTGSGPAVTKGKVSFGVASSGGHIASMYLYYAGADGS